MMHPSVYFSLPDSLIGLFVIMSSPNSYLSEFISGIHFHFHTQAPSFYSHPHLALRKSNKKKVNSKKCMWVFFLFVCFLRFPRLLLSLFHTCSWEHTLHHWSGFVLSVVLLEFIEKQEFIFLVLCICSSEFASQYVASLLHLWLACRAASSS